MAEVGVASVRDGNTAMAASKKACSIALTTAAVFLGFSLIRYLVTALAAIRFPFGIDYGEGIVWQQMQLILGGSGYAPIDGWPAIVFHYPPIYYLVVGGAAQLFDGDPLAVGRLVSVACALATGGVVAAIVPQIFPSCSDIPRYRICAAFAAAMVICTQPVMVWSILMRVDMVSVLATFGGVYCGLRAVRKPLMIFPAALLFVLAVFSKQTAIAAPAAVFGTLMLLRVRTALAGMAAAIALGLVALAVMTWLTDGGFIRHILFYNMNRFRPENIVDILAGWGTHLIYFAISAWVIVTRLRRITAGDSGRLHALRRRCLEDPADACFLIVVVYLSLASVMLLLALKSGAAINYFLEWGCLIAMFSALALADTLSVAQGKYARRRPRWGSVAIPCGIIAQVIVVNAVMDDGYAEKAKLRGELAQLVQMMKDTTKPVLGDDMVGIMRAGKTVQWEPSIFAELASKGQWSEQPLLKRLMSREFAFIVTDGEPGDDRAYDSRYNPAVNQAIRTAYPAQRQLGGYWVHFPGSDELPSVAAGPR